jgi:hypothetical protein
MRKILLSMLTLMLIITAEKTNAQGCVAIKSVGGFCSAGEHNMDTASKWQLSVNNRYLKSFRHFIGTDEQKQRLAQQTEVINHQYTTDLALYRTINPRWSLMLDMPIEANTRSSDVGNGRYQTHSFGVGDIRLAVYSWILDPLKMPKGNVQVGLGLKLPTGSYNYMDYFHSDDTTRVLGPVDQSIQLGDGGTGVTLEVNTFYNFSSRLSVYGNFYYLSNPRNVNGTPRSYKTPSALSVRDGSSILSVPDQWMGRAGVNYMVSHFTFSAGVREECLPVHDLVGGSDGFRRPGYIISAEPGVTYGVGKVSVYAFVPVALVRNRTQSVPDIIDTQLTGKTTHGDAAFADYAINIGANFRF